MLSGEGKAVSIEIVDREVTIGLNDDRARVGFNSSRVDLVRQSFLDDDGVVVERFGLREEVADRNAFAGTAHAEKHGMLWRFISF